MINPISCQGQSRIIDLDNVRTVQKTWSSYEPRFAIQFIFKNGDGRTADWSFKTEKERDKIYDLLYNYINPNEINTESIKL